MAVFAEARRLVLPILLVTYNPDSKLGNSADVVLAAQRGRTGRVALHGATLVGLEALFLGLTAANRKESLAALQTSRNYAGQLMGSVALPLIPRKPAGRYSCCHKR